MPMPTNEMTVMAKLQGWIVFAQCADQGDTPCQLHIDGEGNFTKLVFIGDDVADITRDDKHLLMLMHDMFPDAGQTEWLAKIHALFDEMAGVWQRMCDVAIFNREASIYDGWRCTPISAEPAIERLANIIGDAIDEAEPTLAETVLAMCLYLNECVAITDTDDDEIPKPLLDALDQAIGILRGAGVELLANRLA